HRGPAAAAGDEAAVLKGMKHSPQLARLIDALRALPGVGPKSAQRMAFHLLQDGRPAARALAAALDAALESVARCRRCRMLTEGQVRELILATNSTVEGEATAHFLSELTLRRGIRASRIAHGVPVGGELEYVDGGTLAHALAGRQTVS